MDSLFGSGGWADGLSKIAGQYLDFRRVQTQDKLAADNLRYQQEAARLAAQQQQASGSPAWLMPALLIGGGVVLVFVLLKN